MNTTVVQGLEQQLEDAKELIERRDIVLRLSGNPDFRKIILEDFCTKQCARFTHESTDPNLPDNVRADALGSAQAAGYLKRFLSAQFMLGQNAQNSLVDLEDQLADARAEELEDGQDEDGDTAENEGGLS